MPETGWPAEPDCHGLGLEFDCLGFEDSGLRALGFRDVPFHSPFCLRYPTFNITKKMSPPLALVLLQDPNLVLLSAENPLKGFRV